MLSTALYIFIAIIFLLNRPSALLQLIFFQVYLVYHYSLLYLNGVVWCIWACLLWAYLSKLAASIFVQVGSFHLYRCCLHCATKISAPKPVSWRLNVFYLKMTVLCKKNRRICFNFINNNYNWCRFISIVNHEVQLLYAQWIFRLLTA